MDDSRSATAVAVDDECRVQLNPSHLHVVRGPSVVSGNRVKSHASTDRLLDSGATLFPFLRSVAFSLLVAQPDLAKRLRFVQLVQPV